MIRNYDKLVLQWKDGVLEICPSSQQVLGDIVILEDARVDVCDNIIKIQGLRIFYSYLHDWTNETEFSPSATKRAHPSAIEEVWIERNSGFWFWKKYWQENVKKIKIYDWNGTFRTNKEEVYSIEGKFPFVIINQKGEN